MRSQAMHVEFLAFRASVPASPNWKCRRTRSGSCWRRWRLDFRRLASSSPRTGCIPRFVANLNGDRFVSDPATPLGEDDCVLILSADAGG